MEAAGLEATITPGETSQFDVVADGELVYSKQQVGRFPAEGEVAGILARGA